MRRGSMTVALSLTLLVILALFAATLRSARIAAARVSLASGTEQGLYSLFAGYDRELFERYGLFFVDIGYGSDQPRMGEMLTELEESISCVCQPNRGRIFATGRDILGMGDVQCSILGYQLATDANGSAFRRQICEVMQKELGVEGLEALTSRLGSESEAVQKAEDLRSDYSEEKAMQYYEEDRARIGDEEENPEIPDTYEDPIAAVENLKKMGLLGMAVPDVTQVSAAEVDEDSLPRNRTLQQGMGPFVREDGGVTRRLLLQEYLFRFFPSYTDEEEGPGLRYQVEYAIGGKSSDAENLKVVIGELLAIREASNMVFLMTDETKRAQADTIATVVAFLTLGPEAKALISFGVKLSWAYAEAVMDVRTLLSGGRVPIRKTADTWRMSLSAIASSLAAGFAGSGTADRGIDYEEYLRILLLVKDADSLTTSLMDLVEMNLRGIEGKENFRLDNCLDRIEIEAVAEVGGKELAATRSYGYGET